MQTVDHEYFTRLHEIVFASNDNFSQPRSVPTGKVLTYRPFEFKIDLDNPTRFERLVLSQIKQLLEEGFLTEKVLEHSYNHSPSQASMVNFVQEHPNFSLIGHVTPECWGNHSGVANVIFTGVDYHGNYSPEELKAFRKFAKDCDEETLVKGYLRAWWD